MPQKWCILAVKWIPWCSQAVSALVYYNHLHSGFTLWSQSDKALQECYYSLHQRPRSNTYLEFTTYQQGWACLLTADGQRFSTLTPWVSDLVRQETVIRSFGLNAPQQSGADNPVRLIDVDHVPFKVKQVKKQVLGFVRIAVLYSSRSSFLKLSSFKLMITEEKQWALWLLHFTSPSPFLRVSLMKQELPKAKGWASEAGGQTPDSCQLLDNLSLASQIRFLILII